MKVLDKEGYSHIFFEDDDSFYISVLCGGIGVYDLTIKLTEKEKDDFLRERKLLLEFVNQVNSKPDEFKIRTIDKKFDFSNN
ncbi:MAG: hypothetical protein HRU19_30225 [Pseudobacteriovorax sp.]|nr:hypothetical protein [Pseudobacteriovorax sp.]